MDEKNEQERIKAAIKAAIEEQNARHLEEVKEILGKDYEHFRKFLEKPETFYHAEFYDMLREWANYIGNNKDKFDYINDERWDDIRERIIEDYKEREAIPQEVLDRSDELALRSENLSDLTDEEIIVLNNEYLTFYRENKAHFRFTDEDIVKLEAGLENFVQCCEDEKKSQEALRISEINLQKSMEALDEAMVKEYERTGKMPVLPFGLKERKRGN